jgi:hypothetical protein
MKEAGRDADFTDLQCTLLRHVIISRRASVLKVEPAELIRLPGRHPKANHQDVGFRRKSVAIRQPSASAINSHTDGIWPESLKYIEEQFAGRSPEVVHEITCENAAKFYRLVN